MPARPPGHLRSPLPSRSCARAWRPPPRGAGSAPSCAVFHSAIRSSTPPLSGQLAVVGAVQDDELAHLVQPRSHPRADAEQQRVGLGVVRDVRVVRREDRQPSLVVARVDDQVHRLLDPLRRLLGPEIVEHEEVSLHDRPKHLELGRSNRRIVGASNDPEQIARVVEQTARPCRLDGLLQDGDGEMRLADARLSFEKQALARRPETRRPRVAPAPQPSRSDSL